MGRAALISLAVVVAVACAPSALPRACALLALPLLALGLRWPRWRGLALVALLGAIAVLAFDARLAARLPRGSDGATVELIGTIGSLPDVDARRVRFELAVEQGELAGRRLQASWYSTAVVPGAGERWSLRATVRRPRASLNPGATDLEAVWFERGIDGLATVREGRRLAAAGTGVLATRAWLAARVERACADRAEACGVVAGLAVGRTAGIPAATWEAFRRTGTVHLVAISGLHVTLLGALAAALTGWAVRRSTRLSARVPDRVAAAVVGLVVACGYAALAGASLPAVRTVLMLAVVAVAAVTRRPSSPAAVLGAALVAVLAFDPFAVLAPGFWLSFVGVAALVLSDGGRRGPLLGALTAQRTATLALAPALLAWFGAMPLVAPLANLIAIPWFNLLLVPTTLLGCVLAGPVPAASDACFRLVAWAVDASVPALAALGAAAPQLAVGEGGAIPLVAAAAGTTWLLAPSGMPARWCGALLWLPLIAAPAPLRPGEFDARVLDVGHGLAVLVTTREHTLLYDTGPGGEDGAGAAGWAVAPVLARLGRAADAVVVSHGDRDHAGGVARVLRDQPRARWWIGPGVAAAGEPCRRGVAWEWDGVRFEMLHPGREPPVEDNDGSCVLRVVSPAGTLLLPGDIEAAGEAELLDLGVDLGAEALVVPHHGSASSSGPRFVAAVAPRLVVHSAGWRNRWGFPRAEVVGRYEAQGAAQWTTGRDGAVTLRFRLGVLPTVAGERERRRAWREP